MNVIIVHACYASHWCSHQRSPAINKTTIVTLAANARRGLTKIIQSAEAHMYNIIYVYKTSQH